MTEENKAPDEVEKVETEVVEAPEQKEKSNLQKRIDDITRQKYEALNEKEQALKELEELKAKLSSTNTGKPDPTLEAFDYDQDAYNQALISAEAEKAALRVIEQRDQQQQTLQQQSQQVEKIKKFSEKEAQFSQSVADYDQIAKRPDLPINEVMADIIFNSDNGPAIAYYLGSHLDELYKIKDLPQIQAQRELLSIEMKLTTKPIVSSAPEPVPDIGGVDSPNVDPNKLSPEEWRIWRNRQVHGK